MKACVAVCILALVASALSEPEFTGYHGYKTYRVVPRTKAQLELLQKMSQTNDVDFWSMPRSLRQNIDVMVSPARQAIFKDTLRRNKINFEVLIDDVQTVVDRENDEKARSPRYDPNEKISFNQYLEYDEIVAYLNKLEADYPDLVKVSTIGTTYEGRDIAAITISSGGNGERKAVLIEGGIHAREWIAPSTVLYLVNQLVENSTNSDMIANLDWLIVPCSNPDGYVYTQNQRMWRKNRNKVSALCKGADANRNFGYKWGGAGASDNPCDETFLGESAFSEKESSALRDFAAANGGGDRIQIYMAMHSYGPYFLYPWGYDEVLPDDWEQLDDLANRCANAISKFNGTEFEVGNSAILLYPAAGGSDDYMKGGQGIPYAYTVELPGGGSQGFNPPPSAILPVGREVFECYKIVAKQALQ